MLCSLFCLYMRISLLLTVLLLLLSCWPEDRGEPWSATTEALIDSAFAPFTGDTLADHHVHIIGLGGGASGIEVNADMRSVLHPFKYARFNAFIDAAGITDPEGADEAYLALLLDQIRSFPIPFQVHGLALDRHYLDSGEIDGSETEIYIPNDYVMDLDKRYSEIQAAVSIHPYRADTEEALKEAHRRGVRVVKWVPNAMGIDPSSEQCIPFYQTMSDLDMVLLSHAGDENAIDSQGRQHLGNPLLLRRALDHGVKVVVAHCAVSGRSTDLDDPEGAKVPNFDLFMRMMADSAYQSLLYGDISALTLLNQVGHPLKTLIQDETIHGRLLYGSDYPLPAVNILNNNSALAFLGYLDKRDLPPLEELQVRNPLLYNFVLMRRVKHPDTGQRFSPELFRNGYP